MAGTILDWLWHFQELGGPRVFTSWSCSTVSMVHCALVVGSHELQQF